VEAMGSSGQVNREVAQKSRNAVRISSRRCAHPATPRAQLAHSPASSVPRSTCAGGPTEEPSCNNLQPSQFKRH